MPAPRKRSGAKHPARQCDAEQVPAAVRSKQPKAGTQANHSDGFCEIDQTYEVTKKWALYIVECNDGSLYTGVTTDLDRRVSEHNGCGPGANGRGAAYTRGRRPVTLVYHEQHFDRSEACKREFFVKQLSRTDKLQLISLQRSTVRPRSV
ncbi:MAG: GIY-YIG nuclease family protein [Granulosicoccus sp.]